MDFSILQLAGPPVVGAFIGYLTNKVAIRMLFRPLKPWRFLGLRVPMTPGVIPSKRQQLAENIGEMVGEHLLTSRDISVALSREQFQDHLLRLVDGRVRDILHRDLAPVPMIVPRRFRAYFKIAVRTLKSRLKEGVVLSLHSDALTEILTRAIQDSLELFTVKELELIIGGDKRKKFYDFIDRLILALFNDPRAEEWLGRYLLESIRLSAQKGRRVIDLLPAPLVELLLTSIKDLAPALLEKVAVMVSEPRVRDKIVHALRKSIDDFIISLGPLAAVVGGFLDAELVEKKIRDYLAGKEEELANRLQDREVRDKLASVLVDQAEKLLNTPLAVFLGQVDEERIEKICVASASRLLVALRSEDVFKPLSLLIRENLEEFFGCGKKNIKEILAGVLPANDIVALKALLLAGSLDMLRSDRVKQVLGNMLNSIVDGILAQPVGVLYDLMPPRVRDGISEYIVQAANNMLSAEVPGIIGSLNIRRTVAAKVDSLDLLRLEQLLLSIMEEQFKYINLFGALLGFLIGIINLLVLRL